MIDEHRWGVLYCPKRGVEATPARKQWRKVEAALDAEDVSYDFVQSENEGSVERLVRLFVDNGYRTIIIVGGDSALNDAVNVLMTLPQAERDNIALGVIPNGAMNDFARYWGFREGDIEHTVHELARHRVRRVDVGCVHYVDKASSACERHFLNCVNIGLIADVMNVRQEARSLLGSRTLSFLVSLVLMIFHRFEYKMDLRINSTDVHHWVMTVCVGNGHSYGQTPSAVPYNGMMDVSIVYQPKVMQLLGALWLSLTGGFLNHRCVHPYRTREVLVREARHARVGVDGRLLGIPVGEYRITIAQEVLCFLIPE